MPKQDCYHLSTTTTLQASRKFITNSNNDPGQTADAQAGLGLHC